MSDQAVLLPKWCTHTGINLVKGQLGHLNTFLTMPIMIFSLLSNSSHHSLVAVLGFFYLCNAQHAHLGPPQSCMYFPKIDSLSKETKQLICKLIFASFIDLNLMSKTLLTWNSQLKSVTQPDQITGSSGPAAGVFSTYFGLCIRQNKQDKTYRSYQASWKSM